jgi:hypothetical protein
MIRLSSSLAVASCVLSAAAASPAQIAQDAYLKASNTGAADVFATSLSVSGDTLVVGAPGEDGSAAGVNGADDDGIGESGAAYVFVRGPSGWSQQAYLKASNPGTLDRFGHSVAVSGDTVVVGAYLEDSDSPGAGAVYVFVRAGTTWSQQAYLKASNGDQADHFGYSLAISDDTVVVGARRQGPQTANAAGAAYVFVRSGTTWSEQQFIQGSNTEFSDEFGTSVAVHGDTLLVGAPWESSIATGVGGNELDNSSTRSGAAYVFHRSGTTWTQQAYLKASNSGSLDYFGWSVDLSGDMAVVGARQEDSGAVGVGGDQTDNATLSSGAAYVFARDGAVWSQQAYLKASNTGPSDEFGTSVALSGDRLIVGAPGEGGFSAGVNGNQNNIDLFELGAAYAFVRCGTDWIQQAYVKASSVNVDDDFGAAVAVSGDTVLIGAPENDSNATGVNGNEFDFSAALAGAGYVFDMSLWSDLGGGTTGIAGQPTLTAASTLLAGCDLTIDLEQAPPVGLTLFRASLNSTPVNVVGGTLHTVPFDLQLALVTDATGAIHLAAPVAPGAPSGLDVYFQFIVHDVSTLHGITLSNAVTARTP